MCQTKHKAYQASEAYVIQAKMTPPSVLDPKVLQKMIQDSVIAALTVAYSAPNEDPNGITDDPSQSDTFTVDDSGNSTSSPDLLRTSFTHSSDGNDDSHGESVPNGKINPSIPTPR
ncbi:hypothetical protein HAX54_001725 [Datura stramonium]|uniref:Uncharacterized protein n=1 Tax=Datura stramonium TaxID=4076 RepID=A0ABS8T2U0_DATST|nr:hypothetical protein [Datura stramonium]